MSDNEATQDKAATDLAGRLEPLVGRCGSCKHRDKKGYCQNEKLAEDWGQSDDKKSDMLVYDYSEGGGFWVGEKFGCVHHTPNA